MSDFSFGILAGVFVGAFSTLVANLIYSKISEIQSFNRRLDSFKLEVEGSIERYRDSDGLSIEKGKLFEPITISQNYTESYPLLLQNLNSTNNIHLAKSIVRLAATIKGLIDNHEQYEKIYTKTEGKIPKAKQISNVIDKVNHLNAKTKHEELVSLLFANIEAIVKDNSELEIRHKVFLEEFRKHKTRFYSSNLFY